MQLRRNIRLRRRSRRSVQRPPAIGTENILTADLPLALRTIQPQLVTALRAEGKPALHAMSAVWTRALQRLPQHKVKKNAESVGNHNGDDCPERRAHPAPLRVAVDVAKDQQVTAAANSGQQAEYRSRPGRRSASGMMMSHDDVEKDLGGHEADHCQNPRPSGDDLHFSLKDRLIFVGHLHKRPAFSIGAERARSVDGRDARLSIAKITSSVAIVLRYSPSACPVPSRAR